MLRTKIFEIQIKPKKEKEEEVAKRELEQKGKLVEAEKREKVAAALLIEEKAAADLREKELAEKKAAEEKENQREVVNVHTGKSIEQIEKDFDRDNWMTAAEAKEYGLVDEVLLINPRKQKKD